MKNAVFWDVTLCKYRCFGGTYYTCSPILVIPIMEELISSETSIVTRATRRNFPEDDILLYYIIHI
jgi:hypothetical protein